MKTIQLLSKNQNQKDVSHHMLSPYFYIDCNLQDYVIVDYSLLQTRNSQIIDELKQFPHQTSFVVNGDTRYYKVLKDNYHTYTYGLKNTNHFYPTNILETSEGLSFDLYVFKELFGHFTLNDRKYDDLLAIVACLAVFYLEGYNYSKISLTLRNHE